MEFKKINIIIIINKTKTKVINREERHVVVLSILILHQNIILHYNMYYFHFTLQETQVSLTRFLQSEVKIYILQCKIIHKKGITKLQLMVNTQKFQFCYHLQPNGKTCYAINRNSAARINVYMEQNIYKQKRGNKKNLN